MAKLRFMTLEQEVQALVDAHLEQTEVVKNSKNVGGLVALEMRPIDEYLMAHCKAIMDAVKLLAREIDARTE